MSGGATTFRPRDTLSPHQRRDDRLSAYTYQRTQNRMYSNSFSPNVSSRTPRISNASPSFSAHTPKLSVVDHSNHPSSTYLNHNSYSSSNRSSTATNPSDHQISSRKSGRGTPSSESSRYSKKSERDSKTYNEAILSLTPKARAISVVDLSQRKDVSVSPSKKKGFRLFSFFRRSKKKSSEISVVEADMDDLNLQVKSPAELRAEELRLLHEEEFTKLRRQREKEKNRSIYDMLPQNRQVRSEPVSRNISSPSSNFSVSPSTGFLSPVSTPRIRSSSSVNVGMLRPNTAYYPNHFNPTYSNHPASQSSTHFPSMIYPEKGFCYTNSTGAHRSTDSVNMQHTRNLARSPLIPSQPTARRSFYGSTQESYSQQMLHPQYNSFQQFPQSLSPHYNRTSRA